MALLFDDCILFFYVQFYSMIQCWCNEVHHLTSNALRESQPFWTPIVYSYIKYVLHHIEQMCTLLYYTGPMHKNACLQLDNEGMGWLSPYSSTLQQFP